MTDAPYTMKQFAAFDQQQHVCDCERTEMCL